MLRIVNCYTFRERRGRQLIFVPVTIPSSQVMELSADKTTESATHYGTCIWCFGQTTGEEINVTDIDVYTLQCSNGWRIDNIAQFFKSGDFGQTTELTPFDVARDTMITTVLNNLSRKIQTATYQCLIYVHMFLIIIPYMNTRK